MMPLPSRRHAATAALALACALLAGGCGKETQERIDRLEAELREVRSDTRDSVESMKSRVDAAEKLLGKDENPLTLIERLGRLEGSFGTLAGTAGGGNSIVYLRPNLQGHSPLATDHGIFLVRIEGIDLDIDSGSFKVHLNIGNPHAIAVEQFTLTGDHGGGTPELDEGEEYSLDNPKIRAWQETLQPFEAQVTKTLEPFSWTPFDIDIAADSRDQLEMIRFSMTVENARLKRADTGQTRVVGGGGGTDTPYAHIRVDSEAASVIRTDYGAFLVTVKQVEETELGTRLHLEVGNPYGFTINQARFVGEHGPAVPRRSEVGSPEEFNEKMREWGATLQPFEAAIPDKLSNFRWNRTSILIPGPAANVQFLRCQLRVEDVTLPAAGEAG